MEWHLPRLGGPHQAVLVASIAAVASSSLASAGVGEPLEVVAVDVSAYPTVVLDVVLPSWESVEQVGADAFTVTGAGGLTFERLDPGDLSVAFVLDNGQAVPRTTLASHQGAAIELIRNLPEGVSVALGTTGGAMVAPTEDRAAIMEAISRLDTAAEPAGATLGPAVIHSAALLEVTDDSQRQLIVFTGDGIDVTASEAASVTGSLDRSLAAMRVVAIGAGVGANLERAAVGSGGMAVAIADEGGAVVRAVDVLTTTFADQFRLTATMPAPGPLIVSLSVGGHLYEASIPDLGPPLGPPAATATSMATSTASSTVATAPTTAAPAPSSAVRPTPVSTGSTDSAPDRARSSIAAVEAVFGVAAITLVVVAIRRRRRR